jgi:hypothetical protein
MDWTFWVGGAVILGLFVVSRVFLHERRWSQRPRPEDDRDPEPIVREEPDVREGPSEQGPPQDGDAP